MISGIETFIGLLTVAVMSLLLPDVGRLIMFGSNKHGQLGTGDFKKHNSPHVVEGPLLGKTVTKVACGDDFTVAATSGKGRLSSQLKGVVDYVPCTHAVDNTLYSWGLGDGGQLGAPVPAGRKAISVPRPVFGSLYSIPELSCRHWHTIMIGGESSQ